MTAVKETHLCVFVGSFRIARRTVIAAVGANQDGVTQLLAYAIGKQPKPSAWMTVLEAAAANCRSKLIPSAIGGAHGRRLLFVTQLDPEIGDAVEKVFGYGHSIQLCRSEKERKVLELVPRGRKAGVKRALAKIWKQEEGPGYRGIESLADGLRAESPEAASELESGLSSLFTINRLGLPDNLHRFLGTTGLINKLEKDLRSKVRRRAQHRASRQASADALTEVCRETLLCTYAFGLDLKALAAALAACEIVTEPVPPPPEYVSRSSGSEMIATLDANVQIRMRTVGADQSEPTLTLCLAWIKSATAQMWSLLNAHHTQGAGYPPPQRRLPEKDPENLDGNTRIASSELAGPAAAFEDDQNLLPLDGNSLEANADAAADLDKAEPRLENTQNGHSDGAIVVRGRPSNGRDAGRGAHWEAERLALLSMRSIRGVARHARHLAKRVEPLFRRRKGASSSGQTNYGRGSRDIATLADRLFVVPGPSAPRCVIFSGLHSGAGCSSIASSVAEMLACRVSGSVCLVDANCREPSLHRMFDIDNTFGFVEAANSPESIRRFAQNPVEGNLWVLPTHPYENSPTGFPPMDHLRILVNELTAEFDYVLIDGPPLGATFDSALLARMADGLVLVIEAGKTPRERAHGLKRDLDLAEVHVLGAVLNKRTLPIPAQIYRRFLGNC